jgi:cyclophilin family peptidyl-prolyl cis-trans isomerase
MKKLFLLISALALFNCGADAQKKEKPSKADKEFLSQQADGLYAKFETSRGDIYAQLDEKLAPMTVANFVGLAEGKIKNSAKPENTPYYDGLKFHRVIPGFMIQGGCPQGTGGGDPGYSFDDEIKPESEAGKKGYERGVLAMANRGPNTNGSQFFMMHQKYNLPYNYTIFGRVLKGQEVVDSIATTPRGGNDVPNTDQTIRKVTILRKGKTAEAFDAPKVFEAEKASAPLKAAERAKAQDAARAAANAAALKKFENATTTPSGLKYIMLKEGEGESPKENGQVTVFYSCMLTDGTVVDSNFGKEPISFGLNQVIAGWREGVQLMKPGGKIQLYVPYQLAWGENPYGGIPAKSDVMFDIELVKVN